MAASPTSRSLEALRGDGWHAEVVERWVPGVNIRRDLLGFIDILCWRGPEVMGVQTTSATNLAARCAKIAGHPNLAIARSAGWRLEVHGWRRNAAGKWVVTVRDVS